MTTNKTHRLLRRIDCGKPVTVSAQLAAEHASERARIMSERAAQRRAASTRFDPDGPIYDGTDLRPFEGRPGALDFLMLPSRMGKQLVYRRGSVYENE